MTDDMISIWKYCNKNTLPEICVSSEVTIAVFGKGPEPRKRATYEFWNLNLVAKAFCDNQISIGLN